MASRRAKCSLYEEGDSAGHLPDVCSPAGGLIEVAPTSSAQMTSLTNALNLRGGHDDAQQWDSHARGHGTF